MKAIVRASLVAAWACGLTFAAQAADYRKLTPFMIDLPGWTAEPAKGMNLDAGGQKMVSVDRQYQKGDDKTLSLHISAGAMVAGQAAAMASQPMKMETSEGRVETTTIDGFPATIHYSFADKNGGIVVVLGPAAFIGANFEGISEQEGMELFRKIDWKAVKATLD